jgi:lipid-A-disaccharide synthase-like uncharacterized protein
MIEEILGILGLVLIILGNLTIYKSIKIRRKYTYSLLIAGAALLVIYSIIIKDLVFIMLEVIFLAVSVYGFIRIHEKKK